MRRIPELAPLFLALLAGCLGYPRHCDCVSDAGDEAFSLSGEDWRGYSEGSATEEEACELACLDWIGSEGCGDSWVSWCEFVAGAPGSAGSTASDTGHLPEVLVTCAWAGERRRACR